MVRVSRRWGASMRTLTRVRHDFRATAVGNAGRARVNAGGNRDEA